MNAKILHAGLYSGRKRVVKHFHHGIELVYTVSGHCAHRTSTGLLDASPGKIIIIPPLLQHWQIDFSEVVTLFVVFELDDNSFSQTLRVLDLCNDPMVEIWFRQLYELFEQRCIAECNKLLELLLLHLLHKEGDAPTPNEVIPQRVQQASDYIVEHFKEKISVRDVACFCKCSESYLNALFNRYYGKSVSRYITELRLSLARRLLLHSPLSTKEICDACGYSRSNYFCRIFKREHNCSPSAFRMKQNDLDYNR